MNTKTARKFVRNALSTTSGEIWDSFTDKSIPGHRHVSFHVVFKDETEREPTLDSISEELAKEGIMAGYSCGHGPTYLRLYHVPFDG